MLSERAGQVQAVLCAWPLGELGDNALADILSDRAELAGRLAGTLPRATGEIPTQRAPICPAAKRRPPVVEPGHFSFAAGASSSDVPPHAVVDVAGAIVVVSAWVSANPSAT